MTEDDRDDDTFGPEDQEPSSEDIIAPLQERFIVIGYRPQFHGPQSLGRDARVTVHELEVICRYWADQRLGVDEEWACWGSTGSYALHLKPYSARRLDYLGGILGEERVGQIIDEVYKDFDPPQTPGILVDGVDWPATYRAGYFGTCPRCGAAQLVNVGPMCWLVCDEHRVKWQVQDGLVPEWQGQAPEVWAEAVHRLAHCDSVQPALPPRRNRLLIPAAPQDELDAQDELP